METKKERTAKLEAFFKAYAKRFTDAIQGEKPDVKGVVNSFAESFIESSPAGIIAGKNNKKFKEMIPKGYEYYKSIGTTGMTIKSKEITFLDDFHSMVKVHWKSDYEKKDKSKVSIEFDVFYLLQEKDGEPKIFTYITGDEEKVIKDNGLEPYK